jgi:hypothetical protein
MSERGGAVHVVTARQQMRWTPRGAHLLLQIRVQALNDDLHTVFQGWYPRLNSSREDKLAA